VFLSRKYRRAEFHCDLTFTIQSERRTNIQIDIKTDTRIQLALITYFVEIRTAERHATKNIYHNLYCSDIFVQEVHIKVFCYVPYYIILQPIQIDLHST
jgi:hypothetical protein